MDKVSFSSTCTSIAQSTCESYQEVEEEGNRSPQEVGGQVVWEEVVDYWGGGTFLLGGRGRRGLITAMEIEGVKGRQSWREKDSSAILPW